MGAQIDLERARMRQKFANINWLHHPCGWGSLFENTELCRKMLVEIARKYDIRTVSDAGAGDLSWIRSVEWDVEYTPYDLRKWHPDIVEFDITSDVLPKTDLIVCRWVLNHLKPELAMEALERFKESRSKYLFVTCADINIPLFGSIKRIEMQEDKCTPAGKRVFNMLFEIGKE